MNLIGGGCRYYRGLCFWQSLSTLKCIFVDYVVQSAYFLNMQLQMHNLFLCNYKRIFVGYACVGFIRFSGCLRELGYKGISSKVGQDLGIMGLIQGIYVYIGGNSVRDQYVKDRGWIQGRLYIVVEYIRGNFEV